MRRATDYVRYCIHAREISIHALLAESDFAAAVLDACFIDFYPRSPCGERHDTSSLLKCQVKFLSTLSLRRATWVDFSFLFLYYYFYPRSPCGERPSSTVIVILRKNFYPRSPCGERRYWPCVLVVGRSFLSTLSLRRATSKIISSSIVKVISIHALLAESDPEGPAKLPKQIDFYPRSPCGERLINTYHRIFGESISIHALLAESDRGQRR